MSHGGYSQSIIIQNPFYTMYCVPEINFGNNVLPPGITEKQQKTTPLLKRNQKK